jgi:hypothetical protein
MKEGMDRRAWVLRAVDAQAARLARRRASRRRPDWTAPPPAPKTAAAALSTFDTKLFYAI